MSKVSISIVVAMLVAMGSSAIIAQLVQAGVKDNVPGPVLINRCDQAVLDDPHAFRCNFGRY